MTYAIQGLDPVAFSPLFAMNDAELAWHRAIRVRAAASSGFPCRVSLRDADEGDELMLVHHVNHDVETPYRNAFAVYVRKDAGEAARYVDVCPPVFASRPIALRCYDAAGMLVGARLAMPGSADAVIREVLDDPQVAYIDAHNAAHGCFSARIDLHD